jgi:hypothetical protein
MRARMLLIRVSIPTNADAPPPPRMMYQIYAACWHPTPYAKWGGRIRGSISQCLDKTMATKMATTTTPFCYKAETQRAKDAIAYRASLATDAGEEDESSDDGYIRTAFCNSRKRTRAVQSASGSGSAEDGNVLAAKRARRTLAEAVGMSRRSSRMARTAEDRANAERDPVWETRNIMALTTAEQTENYLALFPGAEHAGAFGRLVAVVSQAIAATQGDAMGLERSKDVQRARDAYLVSEHDAVVAHLRHKDRGDLDERVVGFLAESEKAMATLKFAGKLRDPDAYPGLAAFVSASEALAKAAAASPAGNVASALSAYRAAVELAGDDLPDDARKEMEDNVIEAAAEANKTLFTSPCE